MKKALFEVIKALEELTACGGTGYSYIADDDADDAIDYLKAYHELATDSAKFAEWKENPPLTWISVEERMPENDEIVAIRCVTKKGAVSWNRAYWDGNFWHGSGSFAGVTHWMAIPILPEKEK